jgi:hypothetical protein
MQIPCVEKDIPLPDGLRSEHVQCVLGEDVVLLIEVGVSPLSSNPSCVLTTTPGCLVFFWRPRKSDPQDREDRLSPHLDRSGCSPRWITVRVTYVS